MTWSVLLLLFFVLFFSVFSTSTVCLMPGISVKFCTVAMQFSLLLLLLNKEYSDLLHDAFSYVFCCLFFFLSLFLSFFLHFWT